MITGIQTFGQLVHFHPHSHTIVTDGGFAPDGAFVCLPRIDTDRLLAVWEAKVFAWDRDEIRQRFRYNWDPQSDGAMAIDGV